MIRVVVIGGGISGLVCAHVFSRWPGVTVKVLEPNRVGGEFLSGGLKYIHASDDVKGMFRELDLASSRYQVKGGIMLKGEVHPYPKCFADMTKEQMRRIQDDHYRKTRRAEPGTESRRAMNDPASTKPSTALWTDFEALIDALADEVYVVKAGLRKVMASAQHVMLDTGASLPYDFLVFTIPLWIIRNCVDWYVPHGVAMKLNVVNVMGPRRDRYAPWDYVYTPYTPANAIHRFSPHGEGYTAEVNGDLDLAAVYSDLNFIFEDGWYMKGIKRGLKGHLLPLGSKIEWPSNMAPLGRFAMWDSRATMDVVLSEAKRLAKEWFK